MPGYGSSIVWLVLIIFFIIASIFIIPIFSSLDEGVNETLNNTSYEAPYQGMDEMVRGTLPVGPTIAIIICVICFLIGAVAVFPR